MSQLFNPLPKQQEFLEAVFSFKHRYLLIGGGVGGGKSYAVLGSVLTLLVTFPGSKAVVIRGTYPELMDTTIKSWERLINNEIGPASFIISKNASQHIYNCANGSQIQFIAEDFAGKKDLSHLYGLEFNFAVLEEAGMLQEATFLKCIERCGRWIPPNGRTPPPLIMLTTNPTNNWVRRLFYDPWVTGTLTSDFYYLPALVNDNKYIFENTAFMESTRRNTPTYLYRRQFEGDWDIEAPSENRIYRCFNPDVHISKVEYDASLPLQLSFDENVNPFMSLLVAQIVKDKDNVKNIHVIDEILGRNPLNTVEGVCTLFKKKYSHHKAGMQIFGDSTSLKRDTKVEQGVNFYTLIAGYLQQFKPKICVPKSNPSVILRTSFFDAIFEKEFANIRFRVDEHCRETINDFILTRTDSDGTKLKENVRDNINKVSYQPHGHLTDCADYFLCQAFNSEFMLYQNGGRTPNPISYGKNALSRNHIGFVDNGNSIQKRISKNSYR